MKRSLESTSSSAVALTSNFRALAVSGTAFGAVAFIAARRALSFASAVEENASKATVVFGDNLVRVRQELADLGDEIGRSRHSLLDIASTFQDTFVPLGFARDRASELSVDLTKLTSDLGSFYNLADSDVARSLASGLVGNTENFRRFGINISQTDVKNEILRLGLADTTDELAKQAKVLATLELLYQGTEDAQGDAARTSQGYANQTKRLNDAFGDYINALTSGKLGVAAAGVRKLGDAFQYLEERQTRANQLTAAADGIGSADPQEQRLQLAALQKYADDLSGRNGLLASLTAGNSPLDSELIQFRRDNPGGTVDDFVAERAAQLSASRVFLDDSNIGQTDQGVTTEARSINAGFAEGGIDGGDREEQRLITQRDEYNRAIAATEEAQLKNAIANEHAAETLRVYNEVQAEAKKRSEDLESAFGPVADSVSNALAEGFIKGKLELDTFQDIFKQFVSQFIAQAIRAQIVGRLVGAIFSGGATPDPSTGVGSLDAAANFSFGARRRGGHVNAGVPYLVGEKGPEIFRPNNTGSITPNNRIGGGSSGPRVVVNQNITLGPGADAGAVAALANLRPQLAADAVQAVQRAAKSDPGYAASLSGA